MRGHRSIVVVALLVALLLLATESSRVVPPLARLRVGAGSLLDELVTPLANIEGIVVVEDALPAPNKFGTVAGP